ncbi:MAG: TetR/AcrR family transcriptional regulator [Dermatophilaceae bacterium]
MSVRPASSSDGRRGRRAGQPDTRGDILDAARYEFAESGYDGATVRAIAGRAGVDPALVHHYYGTKEQLFAAATHLPLEPADVAARIIDGPTGEIGERAVRVVLAVWGHPASRAPFLLLLRGAMSSEAGSRLLREFVHRALLGRVAVGVTGPDAAVRVSAAASQLVGLAIVRYVLRMEPLASLTDDEVVELVAPTIQRYLGPAETSRS